MISSLARIPKILSIMSIAAATHLIAHNNGLEGGPGCMAAHNETYQKPIVETSDPSISDDSRHRLGRTFYPLVGFEREEKIQQKAQYIPQQSFFLRLPKSSHEIEKRRLLPTSKGLCNPEAEDSDVG